MHAEMDKAEIRKQTSGRTAEELQVQRENKEQEIMTVIEQKIMC